jgi:hypothetical protein
LSNRDKELGGPLLRIFYGTKAFGDIKYALEKFLAQRKVGKQKTIEKALQRLIVELLFKNSTLELSMEEIWNALPSYIPGIFNPQNPNEFQTIEYGSLHRNTLSQRIESIDMLGATRKRKSDGSVLTFEEMKVKELKKIHGFENQDKDKGELMTEVPNVYIELRNENDYTPGEENERSVSSVSSVSSEGYRVCGFVIEEEMKE